MNITTFKELTDEELMVIDGGKRISSYQAGKYVGYGIDVILAGTVLFFL